MKNDIIIKDKIKIYFEEYGEGKDLILLHGNDGTLLILNIK